LIYVVTGRKILKAKQKITNVNQTMVNLCNHKISGISFISVSKMILCIIYFTKNIYCFNPRAIRNIKPVASKISQIPEGNSGGVTCMLARIIQEKILKPRRGFINNLLLRITLLNTKAMCMIKYVNRLERIDALVFMKATGTPEQFAGKLGIRRSTLYQTLQEIRFLGVEIKYCCHRRSYYYANDRRIRIIIEAISKN
jgi:hypothetical protein